MTLIIDASVALKWVIEEEDSAAAKSLLLGDALAAPDLLAIECANVLWVKTRRGVVAAADAKAALDAILATPIQFFRSAEHAAAAQSIAFDLGQTAYDSLYLAAALAERATLVTADAVFAAAAKRHATYRSAVRLLSE